jgi:DNA-binding MarR family transcriptional regulator
MGRTSAKAERGGAARDRSRCAASATGRLSETELRAWQALLHAHYEITRRLDADLQREHGLTFEAYDVLLRLANAPEHALPMTQLARRVLAPASTVTRRVDHLERAGLISRSRSSQDSRLMIASLTPAGVARLRRAARTHLRGIHEHFTGQLRGAELSAVAAALEVIVGPHERH